MFVVNDEGLPTLPAGDDMTEEVHEAQPIGMTIDPDGNL